MKSVAIIGGGPAGSMAAERLARGGFRVAVFEERRGWEKPCGGGMPARALRRYPFLLDSEAEAHCLRNAELIAADGESIRVRLASPMAIFDRARLNGALLLRAERAGAEVISDRIVGLVEAGHGWRLVGRGRSHEADFVILAAGARSRLRAALAGDLTARDFMLTYGYLIPSSEMPAGACDCLRVRYFEGFEGYAWSFPRGGHVSVGICRKATEGSMPELKERLHGYMMEQGIAVAPRTPVAHLLPSLAPASWAGLKLSGPNWALAGDAAGLVDPVTGEGIYYAMRSGELAAECLAAGAPGEYFPRVWSDFGRELAQAARLTHLLFHGDVLGRPVTTRMIQLCGSNRTLGKVLEDLLDGRQSYATLCSRLYKGFVGSLGELVARSLAGVWSGSPQTES